MAMALQPSPKTLGPRPQAADRSPQRTNQPSPYLQLGPGYARPCGPNRGEATDARGPWLLNRPLPRYDHAYRLHGQKPSRVMKCVTRGVWIPKWHPQREDADADTDTP